MAIAFRSASSAAPATSATNGNFHSVTIPKPAGLVAGDVMIAFIAGDNWDAQSFVPAISGEWTQIATNTSAAGQLGVKHTSFYRVVTSADASKTGYTFNRTVDLTGSGGSGIFGGIAAFSGVDNATPINTSAVGSDARTSSPACPSVTTTVTNTMVLPMVAMMMAGGGAVNYVPGSITPPSGYTELWEQGLPVLSAEAAEMSGAIKAAAGATGTLTATTSGGTTDCNTQTVALKPKVTPTADFTYTTAPGSATFTDTSTPVSPATIASRSWDFGDGSPAGTTTPVTHNYASAGNKTVTLTVTDSASLTGTKTQTITIPTRANVTHTNTAAHFVFAESNTLESGTTVTSRSWNFGDGVTSTVASPSHDYTAAGVYTVTYSYTDSAGHTWSTSQTVFSPPPAPNQPPVAFFTASTGALIVDFTDQSTDPDGTIVSWAWDFGEPSSGSNTSALQSPSHTYAAGGTYTVSLTVTDDDGATNTYTRSITVRTAGSANSYVAGPIFLRESTLAEGIDATQATIPVAELAYWSPNGALWPSKNEGMLDPEGAAEKITWTGKSAASGPGNLTGVTRGAFGTTAASHTAGKVIGLYGRHDAGLKLKGKIPIFPVNASLTLAELRRHFDSERFVWADFDNLNESAQLEITGAPTSTGNVSTTLDEGGTAVQRNAGVTSAKEVRSLVISAAQTAAGTIAITLNSATKNIALSTGTAAKHQIVYSGVSDGAGAFTVAAYNASNVRVDTAVDILLGDTASTIANRVRAKAYAGWGISGSGSTVIATATTNGIKGLVNPGTWYEVGFNAFPFTGALTVSHTTMAQGSSLLTAAQVADVIRNTSFDGWQTGGTGTTITFTALQPGAMAGTFSYNNGGTGATGTLSQTTAGTQSTPAQVATAIRALYAGNTYWTIGGSGATVTWDALTSGPKQDATFSGGTTGSAGDMQTVHQGSADIVGYLTDSGGVQQTRRLLANLATTTEFNLEASVSGAGTEHGIISFWGSFGTDPLTLLWRVEDLDLTEFPVEEGAYGVTSESASDLTWDVRTDEVELTDRGKTYYRDHNLRGQLLGQLHYFGILEPEQASDDIGVQELWHPVMPGQEVSLSFFMTYENMPVAFPSLPLYITFHHTDGTVTEVGDASGLPGLSGDADWQEYTLSVTAPTLDDNPVPAYWMRIQSKRMSQGTVVIQEITPSLGTVATRTPYYAFEGTFRAQFDARTPKETPYLLLERARTGLEVQFEDSSASGMVVPQYRSAADPAAFDGTWYTDASQVPDLPVIDVDVMLSGDGLSTPEVPAGYPRTEYRARPGKRHLFLKGDRTELPGGVIMDKVADWYRKPGTSQALLPSGHVLKQKLNEPVGYLPSFELWVFRPETVKYLLENLNAVGMLFYAEVFNELLLLKVLTPEPKFTRASLSRFDNEDLGDTSAASRYSFWVSDALSAEVMDVTEISE